MKKITNLLFIFCAFCIIFSCTKNNDLPTTTEPNITNTNNSGSSSSNSSNSNSSSGNSGTSNSNNGTTTGNNSDGTLFKIFMTDAPVAVEEVNIDLQHVIIKGSGGGDTIHLGTNSGIYNLLDFQNGIDTLIASSMITVDTVTQVRLVLGEDNTIKVDGVLHDLKTPSAQQSGLKVNVHLPLDSIDFYNLLLDFDAEESVIQQGNGNYMLKPVLKVL